MYYSYDDAAEAVITRFRAISFIKQHGCDVNQFFADCGDSAEYIGRVILDWLGY